MDSGELRTKIRIQYKKKIGTGSFAAEKWVDLGNQNDTDTPKYVFAKWVNVHGSEAWVANSVQAERGATVTIRFDKIVTEKCRIVLDGINYYIVSLDNIRQLGQWLEIKVKSAVSG